AWKFWITPWLMNTKAKMNEIGNRMRVVERTTSTQKLPIVGERRRQSARMNATATAMPTAAERNCCTTSANIWLRWLIVDSPAYACQLVFVRKLIAVLNESAGATPGRWSGLNGRCPWIRRKRYESSTPARLNAS